MRISIFNQIFRELWMIDPVTASAQKQVLYGFLMGLEFSPENEAIQGYVTHKQSPKVPIGRKISVVNLEGTMLRDDAGCGMVGTRTIASMLREADADPNVIGNILRIDSGGGAANSVPDLADAIQACQKPVVAFVDGFMCSAAMYAGSYCRHIMANREDNRIGCIGTMIQIADYPRQAKDSMGQVHLRIYADGSEEKNDEFESALENDFKLVKERILNPANEKFKADIRHNRPSTRDDQLKGRTYMAKDVLGTLIDSIGDFAAAVDKVLELSNINIQKMEGLNNLQALPTCHDLQMVDGSVSLNQEQLNEIDIAIGTGTANANAVTEKDSTIAQLQKENGSLRSQNAAKDSEIAGLKQTISELNSKPQTPAPAAHNGEHIAEEGDNDNPEDYCKQVMEELYGK